MDWRQIIGKRVLPVAGVVIGAPGVLDSFAFWRQAVGDMSTIWQGLLIGMGVASISMWLYVLAVQHGERVGWSLVAEYVRAFAPLVVVVMVAISLAGGGLYYLLFVHEFPQKPVWVHPTMALSDQDKANATCRMRAVEVVGSNNLAPSKITARSNYVEDCLIAKGFVHEETSDSSP